jgi:hypothetical protein
MQRIWKFHRIAVSADVHVERVPVRAQNMIMDRGGFRVHFLWPLSLQA